MDSLQFVGPPWRRPPVDDAPRSSRGLVGVQPRLAALSAGRFGGRSLAVAPRGRQFDVSASVADRSGERAHARGLPRALDRRVRPSALRLLRPPRRRGAHPGGRGLGRLPLRL